jgi:hypothetical protein
VRAAWEVDDLPDPQHDSTEQCTDQCVPCVVCEAKIHYDADGFPLGDRDPEVAEVWWPADPDRDSAQCHQECMTDDMQTA